MDATIMKQMGGAPALDDFMITNCSRRTEPQPRPSGFATGVPSESAGLAADAGRTGEMRIAAGAAAGAGAAFVAGAGTAGAIQSSVAAVAGSSRFNLDC